MLKYDLKWCLCLGSMIKRFITIRPEAVWTGAIPGIVTAVVNSNSNSNSKAHCYRVPGGW